jgi:hypothetical protein
MKLDYINKMSEIYNSFYIRGNFINFYETDPVFFDHVIKIDSISEIKMTKDTLYISIPGNRLELKFCSENKCKICFDCIINLLGFNKE